MPKIFICYRREDSQTIANYLKVKLESSFPRQVFLDTSSLPSGSRWPNEIQAALERAQIVLVLIGEKWLTCHNPVDGRRRLDEDQDWVRLELKTAIQKNKTLIPILISPVRMPAETSLPEDIRGLTRYQAFNLDQNRLDTDGDQLIRDLRAGQKKRASIILTSTSSRRKALLTQIGWEEGIDYETWPASLEPERKEGRISLKDAQAITAETALRKIRSVESDLPLIRKTKSKEFTPQETLIVGVDTVVFCEDKLLDRPLIVSILDATEEELQAAQAKARKMLMEQKGKTVQIITCVSVALASDPETITTRTVVTEAHLRNYSQDEIDPYVASAEPFDKAGAFGIQEKGVSLFLGIQGSYSNVVGLPLREFLQLLQESYGDRLEFAAQRSTLRDRTNEKPPLLSTVAIGDVNYDFIYDSLPEGFFRNIRAPGVKVKGEIYRGAGGTAVNFAKGAYKAGFEANCVVGVVGSDGLGRDIRDELLVKKIHLVPEKADVNQRTSIAVILRDQARADTSVTFTDARQKLPPHVVELAKKEIESADVFYCSGYALMDRNRRQVVQELLEHAKKQPGCLVVFDVVVAMRKDDDFSTFTKFKNRIQDRQDKNCVDILVSELKEVLGWLNINCSRGELAAWESGREGIVARLRKEFPVTILRTSKYTHEIIITPTEVIGPVELDYGQKLPREKLGYGDFQTARLVYEYLSPRILLASKSPQRLQLLQQLVAPEKIQVQVSRSKEDGHTGETPQQRVLRLAREKARDVLERGDFADSIELIIGADTEIISLKDGSGEWELSGHPETLAEAKNDLKKLSGKTHKAITGIVVLGLKPGSSELLEIADCIETSVTFAEIDDPQIEAYVQTREPLSRAGGYAIQGLGALLVERIDGSYSNVVGLPLERLAEILAVDFKKPIWVFNKVTAWTRPQSIKKALQA
jgi:septum formation protein